MHAKKPALMWIPATAMRKTVAFLWIYVTALCLGGSMANANCVVERRQAAGKYYRVIQCDESKEAIDNAIASATESCISSAVKRDDPCYGAVKESFRLRREAMLRRSLKEGASVRAAAQLYGYTEEQVERWIARNTSTDRGYAEPEEVPAVMLQAEQDAAKMMAVAERQAASR